MNTWRTLRTFLFVLPAFGLFCQEIEIPDKPVTKQTEDPPKVKAPAKKAAPAKPKATKARTAVPSDPKGEDPSSPLVANPNSKNNQDNPVQGETKPVQGPVRPNETGRSTTSDQLTRFEFGHYCLAQTSSLQKGGRINPWRARFVDYTPTLTEQKHIQSSLSIPQFIYSQCRFYRISGNNYFGSNRSTFNSMFLVNGPGFINATLVNETKAGEVIKEGEELSVRFRFKDYEVRFWPNRNPGTQPNCFAFGYQNGTFVKYNKDSTRLSVPYNLGGILAISLSEHEAIGVFRFPLADSVVTMKGIRLQNEVLLEADQPKQISLSYIKTDPSSTSGIVALDSQRVLRARIKLDEPRQIDISFTARTNDSITLPYDLHTESDLSLSVTANNIMDLTKSIPDLNSISTLSFEKQDQQRVRFLAQSDLAYAGARLEVYLWPTSIHRGSGETNGPWKPILDNYLAKVRVLRLPVHEALLPQN